MNADAWIKKSAVIGGEEKKNQRILCRKKTVTKDDWDDRGWETSVAKKGKGRRKKAF